ncbi:MAG: putative CRISPR-associated protein [Limnoraphis sp.]
MTLIFLSPCGTSLLTNKTDESLRKRLIATANAKVNDLKPDEKAIIDEHLESRRQLLNNSETDLQEVKRLSAELNGIITYYDGQLPQSSGDIHYILATDTYQGREVADIVVNWLQKRGFNAQVQVFNDLATNSIESFRVAMSDLIQWCDQTLGGYQENQYFQVIFNLTGGFKSVNGFLQAVGMFYASECIYIFQSSSELLRIPRLPISLDQSAVVGEHLMTFRRLSYQQLPVSDCRGIAETLLFESDGFVELSEWGKLIWTQAKPNYYKQKLLPPLSSRLVFSPEFERSVERSQIQPDRLLTLNERLDDLSRYLDTDGRENLRRLDFKALKGKPFADSTHECDVWGDSGDRIFGHYLAEGRYQCDRLGGHL